jgi:hypothetical protein
MDLNPFPSHPGCGYIPDWYVTFRNATAINRIAKETRSRWESKFGNILVSYFLYNFKIIYFKISKITGAKYENIV